MERLNDFVMTKKKFRTMVEDIVLTKQLSYLDAILHLCETNNIEPEDVKKYISAPIKDKLEADAIKLNFITDNTNELPI